VAGDLRTPRSFSLDELKAMPRKRVEVKDEDGRTLAYEGVLVAEVLKRAGATLGSDLRGNAVATYVVASAADGYQAVFSLAELDPALTGSEVIVCRHHRRQATFRASGTPANRGAESHTSGAIHPHARSPRGRAPEEVARTRRGTTGKVYNLGISFAERRPYRPRLSEATRFRDSPTMAETDERDDRPAVVPVECPMCHGKVPPAHTTMMGGRRLCLDCANSWFEDDEESQKSE
jgi:hypothetical protein